MDVAGDGARRDTASVGQHHAVGPTGGGHDLAHRRGGDNVGAGRRRRLGHSLGNGAHAANGVAPGAGLAIDLAEDVMQQHIGGARGIGTGVAADNAVEAERRFQRRTFKPVVEHVAGAFGEQGHQVALTRQAKPAQPIAQGQRLQRFTPTAAKIGRGFVDQGAQFGDHPVEHGAIGRQLVGVGVRELGDGAASVGGVAAHLKRAAVVERQEIGHPPFDNAQAMIGQAQIGDHPRVEQADRVGGQRIAKAWMKFLGDGGAANHRAGLQHPHVEPGAGQIGGGNQAVMAAPDDGHVILIFHRHRSMLADHSLGACLPRHPRVRRHAGRAP